MAFKDNIAGLAAPNDMVNFDRALDLPGMGEIENPFKYFY
jgi:hypothetical protein